jgi:P4 family phage/plasmid primase-like protien
MAGLPSDSLSKELLLNYTADKKAVMEGCAFLRWAQLNPNEVSEPQWYAALSVVGRLEEGREIAHQISKGHSGYSFGETEGKLEQALAASGPRTCDNIDSLWGRCAECKFFKKEKRPILLKGPDFIKTKATGFHDIIMDNEKVRTVPNYEDLMKFFALKHPFVSMEDTGMVYVFDGEKWEYKGDNYIKAFAENHFDPSPKDTVRKEFLAKIKANNNRNKEWFDKSTHSKINLKNGVYDMEKMAIEERTPNHGFRYCLPYIYDESAQAPVFEGFLEDITEGDVQTKELLLQFLGYCISNCEPVAQKALLLLGDGQNGKSTLVNIIRELVGEESHSSLDISELDFDQKRGMLEGKLFNISEEIKTKSLQNAGYFRKIVCGEPVSVKRVYVAPYDIKTRAKIIMTANNAPEINENTKGMRRRLLVVSLDKEIADEDKDTRLMHKLRAEKSGIFNLVINEYKKLVARDYEFVESEIMKEARDELVGITDAVPKWFKDKLVFTHDDKDETSMDQMWTSFCDYCKDRHMARNTESANFARRVGKDIIKRGVKVERIRVDGLKTRIYKGIKIDGAQSF